MPVRKNHTVGLTWFVTFTCYEWLSLFEICQGYDLVYNWFEYLKKEKLADIVAYVIMPNHFHAIMHLAPGIKLNTLIANGKRFMAYAIVERLGHTKQQDILNKMANGVNDSDKMKGQKHRVFETSFDAKGIHTDKFLFQKLHYIHQNPVNGKWVLASDFVMYEHSSASFYELGFPRHFKPRHYGEFWFDD